MGRGCRQHSCSPSFIIFHFYSKLLLLLLFIIVYAQADSTTPFFTPINRDLYHRSDALLKEIEALVNRHPNKLSMETLNSKNRGYEADLTVVTYSQSREKTEDKSKFRILVSFGQHGRELITSELALRIISILSEEQRIPKMDMASLNRTLKKLVIKMVPTENLNGRKLVEDGDLCERKNGRGVDLNRNWSVDWGKKEKDYDPYEENPGTGPFSEPETQLMRKLSGSFEPHMWINVHSGTEALFMPYDHKNTTPDGFSSQRMKLMLKKLNYFYCKNRCMVGSGGGSVGYLAHGTATDYMFDIARVPMAFTFEIYGDGTASTKDCFKMFNPVDYSTFNRVIDDWSAAFFTTFSMGARHMDELQSENSSQLQLISIDDYLHGYLMERKSRYGKKIEVLDLGMQEIRTYYRLFLLSSVVLMFMFCSRIRKSRRPPVSSTSH